MDFSKDDLQAFDPHDPVYRGKLWVRVVTPDRVYRYYFRQRIAVTLAFIALGCGLAIAAGFWAFTG